jgi:hypothetical protein
VDVVNDDNTCDPLQVEAEERAEELDPSAASLLMFGGGEAEHDLATHPDAESLD